LNIDSSRFYAFAIHIVLSGLIFCSVFYLLVVIWYPDLFFTIDGGLKGLKLIALVDVVVGPLLTLLLYRKGKKGLKLDMTIIGVMQLAFLFYGISVLYTFRPAALVFYKGTFYSMGVEKYKHQEDGLERIKAIAGRMPGYVIVDLPADWDEIKQLRRRATAKGEALFAQINHYAPIAQHQKSILNHGRDLTDFLIQYPAEQATTNRWLKERDKKINDFVYIPVVSRFKNTLLALDPISGEIKGCLDVVVPDQLQLPYANLNFSEGDI